MLHEKDETASTNDDARELGLSGAPQGAAVLATRQSKGRGRAGRAFASPPGGLYLSVVLRPERPPDEWGLLPLMAGVVVATELQARGVEALVKWPNDILIGGAKLGGILVESQWRNRPFAIVGIGLNLARSPSVPNSTHLRAHGVDVAPRVLAEALVARLVSRMERWETEGKAPLLAEVRASCATLGRVVEWEKGDGLAVDVADDGALIVERDGERVRVIAGDVRLRLG